MDLSSAIAPWLKASHELVPGLQLWDAHTHVGQNDPDGFKQSPAQLSEVLTHAGARGCFVFPMHEPDGYPAANDFVLEAVTNQHSEHPDGPEFVAFCRVNPHADALAEAERSLANGAKGIKLHPRAEQFQLDHPAVRSLFALAHERELPVLIHAGRGIPALGKHAVQYASEFPGARIILAHAGVCDLAWIWKPAADLPNLLFDSAWWIPSDLAALFTLVPPAQILFAADAPYGDTSVSAIAQIRLMLQCGWSAEQVRLTMSEQSLRIARGQPLAVAGPALGERDQPARLLLTRVTELLQMAAMMVFRTGDGDEALGLARLALDVPAGLDDEPVFAVVRELLDSYETLLAQARAATPEASASAPQIHSPMSLLSLAASVARTPDVPLPAGR